MSTLLFAAALFVSAALLFWVQPLVAKMLLPLLGGTPAVWNTCVLFFQLLLLAGYAYALAVTRWLGARAQRAVHLSLLAAAALSLPVALPEAAAGGVPAGRGPVGWLLLTLAATIGLPFFALSANAPLLQKWFSETRHERADDPYFLYAASNLGSLVALLGFPVLAEPYLRLAGQGRLWSAGYGALFILVAACGVVALRRGGAAARRRPDIEAATGAERLSGLRRLRWALLAFAPSSLVLGVTTYITTDVAAVPLLWVVPLALYLLSFVVAFARTGERALRLADRLLPGAAILLTLVYLSGATEPAWFLTLVHLVFLFVASLACHARLAADRPGAARLAEFYLLVSAGGAAGGLFNALLAPLLFNTVVEYPLAVLLAVLLRAPFGVADKRDAGRDETVKDDAYEDDAAAARRAEQSAGRRALALDFALPVLVGVCVAALTAFALSLDISSIERLALSLGVPLVLINHFFTKRPVRFALSLGAVMLASFLWTDAASNTLHAARNFYGVVRVIQDPYNNSLRLHHGSTIHGRQFTDPARACEPLSYYHRRGPLGSLFEAYDWVEGSGRVAAVGLGAGAVAAYSRPGEEWTFYEINPEVVRLARDTGAFTYLRDCARAPVQVVVGDARLRLREAADSSYDLIILDAFSSDAVPAHLLTREALDLYLSKLAPGGLIAFHVSNRALDLHAVVGGLVGDGRLAALSFDDARYTEADRADGKEPSQWVVAARRPDDLRALARDVRWYDFPNEGRRLELWRDDFSNVVTVLKW